MRAGEIVGVWGRRGAGKTTLLRCAAGVLAPDRGEVRWYGVGADRSGHRGGAVGFVGECPPHHAFLTARQSLAHMAASSPVSATSADRPGSMPDPERGVGALLRRAGLARVADRRLSTLSRGALVRLAIAHALLARPKLLLLDGALDGLDAPWRASVARLLRAVARDGVGCLVTARDFGAVGAVADRVVTLADGCVESQRSAPSAGEPRGSIPACHARVSHTPAAARVAEPGSDECSTWARGRERRS